MTLTMGYTYLTQEAPHDTFGKQRSVFQQLAHVPGCRWSLHHKVEGGALVEAVDEADYSINVAYATHERYFQRNALLANLRSCINIRRLT